MNYWIFKSNPEIYPIDDRLRDPDPVEYWRVRFFRDEIKKGDFAFIWRAGEPRGIIAVLKIDTDHYFVTDNIKNPEFNNEMKIRGQFVLRFPTIEKQLLKQIAGLENLSVFHGYQARTNFPVTNKEGKIIVNLIYKKYPKLPKIQGL